MIHMDQMILSEPSIIIIWTYQDRMEWMNRTLVAEMAGADEDFGVDVEKKKRSILFISLPVLEVSMIHMDQMILSEPSIIIIWTYQERMDGMDEQDVGWRNGWC
jgi:hypothetical protein